MGEESAINQNITKIRKKKNRSYVPSLSPWSSFTTLLSNSFTGLSSKVLNESSIRKLYSEHVVSLSFPSSSSSLLSYKR